MTLWFKRHAGEDIAQSVDDEGMHLVSDTSPDWVRVPEQVGGGRRRVISQFYAKCPMCVAAHGEEVILPEVMHFKVEGGVGVAECAKPHGFVWYVVQLKGDSDDRHD